jgi:hypothetical protein
MMKPQEFHETISGLLSAKLQPLIAEGRALNLVACVEIYTTIFDALAEVVTAAALDMSNECVNYLAQQYYDGIVVNGNQELDPDIFTQRATLEGIQTKELALLAVMLQGTDFALPIVEQIKQRS